MKKNTLELLEQHFGKSNDTAQLKDNSSCVIYTRVSSKDQEQNYSLNSQKVMCAEYAERRGFQIIEYFGGTYESATTDERKEFQKMLSFVKRRKIANIIVYKVDRFSRTGPSGIYIADQLKQAGIRVVSVTQPGDSLTPSGGMSQNMQFIFSQYENDTRKERCVNGMKEHLKKGFWLGAAPFGYTQVGFKKKQEYIINEKGKLIKKAFEWKARGMSNTDILKALEKYGMKLYKQKLTRLFENPFYMGYISHKALEGKIVKGNHPPLISESLFLKANNMTKQAARGFSHNKDDEHLANIPLKRFLKCYGCDTPFTGYIVKKKGLYYYKCNRAGCQCNKSAKKMNTMFQDYLQSYTLSKEYIAPFRHLMQQRFEEVGQESKEHMTLLKKRLMELQGKIDKIDERFALDEITPDIYHKFSPQYRKDKLKIITEIEKVEENLSNLENGIDKAIDLSCNLLKMWEKSGYQNRQRLQWLVFPKGIHYDRQKDIYRTERINAVFELINSLSENYKEHKKRTSEDFYHLSRSVPGAGLEPARPEGHQILSLTCLPIPPSRQGMGVNESRRYYLK